MKKFIVKLSEPPGIRTDVRTAELLDRVTFSNSAGIYPKGGKNRRRNCARAKIKKGSIFGSGRKLIFAGAINKKGGHARPGKGRATANRQTETANYEGFYCPAAPIIAHTGQG